MKKKISTNSSVFCHHTRKYNIIMGNCFMNFIYLNLSSASIIFNISAASSSVPSACCAAASDEDILTCEFVLGTAAPVED